jgi:hypothetical protein
MDIQTTRRVIHALAALRDHNGDVAGAAGKLGISEKVLIQAVASGGPNLFEQSGDGKIQPTHMGLRFAARVDDFPYANW